MADKWQIKFIRATWKILRSDNDIHRKNVHLCPPVPVDENIAIFSAVIVVEVFIFDLLLHCSLKPLTINFTFL